MRKSVLDEKKKRNSSIPMRSQVNHFQTKHIIKYLNSFLPNLELLKKTLLVLLLFKNKGITLQPRVPLN